MLDAIIVTFPVGPNYGSRLQATALRIVLNNMNLSAYFLGDFKVLSFIAKHPTLVFARIERLFGLRKRRRFFVQSDYTPSNTKKERLKTYALQNTPLIDIKDEAQWRSIIASQTVFIAGSDIIWNPARGYPAKHFLDFAVVAGLPCFSYGSSIGARRIPKAYHRAIKRYLSSYISVGVRESSVKKALESIVARPIEQVVDPTLLLTSTEWDEFAKKAVLSVNTDEHGYVLLYFVMDDPRYWEYARMAVDSLGLQAIVLPMHAADGIDERWDRVEDATPYEFVWLIKHASVVVTDSFHACSFCLTYEKEFYLLRRSRKAEDSKYDDFLCRYSLEGRQVNDESRFVRVPPIYSDDMRARLAEDRERSMAFLRGALTEAAELADRKRQSQWQR